MNKKFYTFAEISNLLTIIERLKKAEQKRVRDLAYEKDEMIRKLVMDMQDEKTSFAFVRYHLHGEGDGKQKLYVK